MSEGHEQLGVFLQDQTKFVVQLIEDVKNRVGHTPKVSMPRVEQSDSRSGTKSNNSTAQRTGRSCPKM